MSTLTNQQSEASDVAPVLAALAETSSTMERVEGLRKLGLRRLDIATACGVGEETVRLWSTGKPPSNRHQRLLDRLRYSTLLVLREESSLERTRAWLTSATRDLQGVSPVEAFAERHRDVMRLADAHAVALYDSRNAAPERIEIRTTPDADLPSPRTDEEQGSTSDRSDEIQSLTPSHVRIVKMLRAGLTPKDIAEVLHVADETVSSHIAAIKNSLEVGSLDEVRATQPEVVSDAMARGYLETVDPQDAV